MHEGSPKILFAPHEIAGQMHMLSTAMREKGIFSTCVSYEQQNKYKYPSDYSLNFNDQTWRITKAWRSGKFAAKALIEYDLFNFFYGRSLTPRLFDLPFIKQFGKPIVVHFRGNDISNGDYFEYQARSLQGLTATTPPLQKSHQKRNLDKWRRWGDRLLVSEPHLLRIAPEATLVQQAINCDEWRVSESFTTSPESGGPLRIVHAPTQHRAKGTEFIVAAVEKLIKEGHKLEFTLVEGIPQDKVKDIFERADIGIDQLVYGWYGNVSIQLMALCKPVICYIDPELHGHRPDLPIVSATPKNISDVLESLILDAELRRSLGRAGRDYVERWHDVDRIADQLLQIYRELLR